MSIESEYIVRRFELSDAPSLFAAIRASIDELVYWMPWCRQDYSLKDAEAWVRFTQEVWSKRSEFPLGIFETSTGNVVGGTGVNEIKTAYRIGNIGYWVSSAYTGRGIARFAAKQAALIGFGQLGLTRLEIVALTHNHASQKVAQSLGATRECQARNRLYFKGKPHDAIVYALVPSDVTRSTQES
jgi:ribosomal-protein-serine acetyltransferase